MTGLATQILIELYQCDANLLRDVELFRDLLLSSIKKSNLKVLSEAMEQSDQEDKEIAGVILMNEGHLTIQTWPEHAYAAADLFWRTTTASDQNFKLLEAYLKAALHSKKSSSLNLTRGDPLEIQHALADTREVFTFSDEDLLRS